MKPLKTLDSKRRSIALESAIMGAMAQEPRAAVVCEPKEKALAMPTSGELVDESRLAGVQVARSPFTITVE